MNIIFRTAEDLMAQVRGDLERPHPFAHERVGFISVRAAQGHESVVLIAEDYHPVADLDYLRDPTVGAMMGPEAIRKALELALLNRVGMFHVHMHTFPERLWFSRIDLSEQLRFIPDFFTVRPRMPHGAIVLSPYSAAGRAWTSRDNVLRIAEFNVVGNQTKIIRSTTDGSTDFYG